mgnify:CR=1 FL=1
MCVIFQCTDDQGIHYPIICKDKLKFKNLEKLLFAKLDKNKTRKYFYLLGGQIIDKSSIIQRIIRYSNNQ